MSMSMKMVFSVGNFVSASITGKDINTICRSPRVKYYETTTLVIKNHVRIHEIIFYITEPKNFGKKILLRFK